MSETTTECSSLTEISAECENGLSQNGKNEYDKATTYERAFLSTTCRTALDGNYTFVMLNSQLLKPHIHSDRDCDQ